MYNRVIALRRKHDILQAKIDHEQSRPLPDSVRLALLEKSRFRLRKEIEGCERILSANARLTVEGEAA